MRIQVVGHDESSNAQARTYAEYRVFAALARYASHVRGAQVVLRHDVRHGDPWVACEVTLALEPSGTARTRATGPHAYAAINRVVDRIADLMGRRRLRAAHAESREAGDGALSSQGSYG